MTDGAEYSAKWTCADRGAGNRVTLTKHQAAFFDGLPKPACRCGSTNWRDGGHTLPEIDAELLAAWMADTSLRFLSQDEELLMDSIPVGTLLRAMEARGPRYGQLIEVLLVKVYDDAFVSAEERTRCLDWLQSHQSEWAGDKAIWPYLVEAGLDALEDRN